VRFGGDVNDGPVGFRSSDHRPSNLPADAFMALLQGAGVTAIADVRSVPFSRRFPWFSAPNLSARLQGAGIAYLPFGDALGGRPRDPALYCDSVADY
jgi:uncharacterized protein (DUF488 family)